MAALLAVGTSGGLVPRARAAATPAQPLRICADADNLPYSNRQGAGFENVIAARLGAALGRPIQYHWARMMPGFVRDVLDAGACDVLLEVPVEDRAVRTTRPYYRSSYEFVTRGRAIRSFDDPVLRRLRIGVQALGTDYAPPAVALQRRGLVENLVAFPGWGPRAATIVTAVARGRVGAAVVWGPLAGYYARGLRLRLTPVASTQPAALPMTFAIAMGVRKSDGALAARLNRFVIRNTAQIQSILRSYGVPLLPLPKD